MAETNNVERINFRGAILDMDGVIFDTEVLWQKAFRRANIKFGLKFDEEYRQSCCGKDEQSIRKELRLQCPDLDVDMYRDFIINNVTETVEKYGADLKNGFCELIAYLKNKNYKIALATSSDKERALKLFRKKNLDPLSIFDGLVFSEDVKVSKPDPEIFLIAARMIELPPHECIVLEDSLNGIRAAKLGGFVPVMVKDLIEPNEDAKKSCLFIVKGLNDVVDCLKGKSCDEKN